jgi:hypothetical protein
MRATSTRRAGAPPAPTAASSCASGSAARSRPRRRAAPTGRRVSRAALRYSPARKSRHRAKAGRSLSFDRRRVRALPAARARRRDVRRHVADRPVYGDVSTPSAAKRSNWPIIAVDHARADARCRPRMPSRRRAYRAVEVGDEAVDARQAVVVVRDGASTGPRPRPTTDGRMDVPAVHLVQRAARPEVLDAGALCRSSASVRDHAKCRRRRGRRRQRARAGSRRAVPGRRRAGGRSASMYASDR